MHRYTIQSRSRVVKESTIVDYIPTIYYALHNTNSKYVLKYSTHPQDNDEKYFNGPTYTVYRTFEIIYTFIFQA